MTKSNRLSEIDTAKGLAIFLVVFGHIYTGEHFQGNDWFLILHRSIYRFHMPLFMCLSGAVYYYKFKPPKNVLEYVHVIKRKASRLLPGFVLFAVIIFIGKLLMNKILQISDPPQSIYSDILNILINPYYSVAGTLWYIYVLFEFYLIAPILLTILRQNLYVNLIIALILYLISIHFEITSVFMINLFFEYYFYFSLGFFLATHYNQIIQITQKYNLIFYCFFILSFISIKYLPGQYNKLVIASLSVPAILAFVNSRLVKNYVNKFLLLLGDYTLSIYLMNTIFLGLFKAILFKLWNWEYQSFFIFLFILLSVGIYLPILTHKYLFSKYVILGRITK